MRCKSVIKVIIQSNMTSAFLDVEGMPIQFQVSATTANNSSRGTGQLTITFEPSKLKCKIIGENIYL